MLDFLPIIVQPTGGLCNRMRTIAAAARLAEILGKKIWVFWTCDVTLNAPFRLLFQPLPFPVVELRLGSFVQRLLWFVCRKLLHYRVYDDTWVSDARGKDMALWKDEIVQRPIFLWTSSDIFKGGGDYSIFRMSDDLKAHALPSYDNVIGVHIRRTDNEKSVRFSPTELFVRKIEEELKANPSSRFYLATDDPKEEAFLCTCSDRIIVYKKESLDRNSPAAIRDAVIDLYNLAHCQKIYGSYWSSFSDVAALWGGIEKEVLKTDDSV